MPYGRVKGKKALDHGGELAQGQKSANVKRFSHGYPPWAISGNWPRGVNSSGKTLDFGVLAPVVAQRGRRWSHPF